MVWALRGFLLASVLGACAALGVERAWLTRALELGSTFEGGSVAVRGLDEVYAAYRAVKLVAQIVFVTPCFMALLELRSRGVRLQSKLFPIAIFANVVHWVLSALPLAGHGSGGYLSTADLTCLLIAERIEFVALIAGAIAAFRALRQIEA